MSKQPTTRQQHPFLDPLWRRIVLVAFCAAWAAFEFHNGDQTWSTITLGLAAYAAWSYLYAYKPSKPEKPEDV